MRMPRAHRADPSTSTGRRALVGLLVLALATVGWGVVTLAMPSPAGAASAAWPTSWETYKLASGNAVRDNTGDENPGTSDLTSGTCSGSGGGGCQGALPTVYYAGDASTAFFRFRMADDNNDSTKGGYTASAFVVQMYDASNTLKAIVGVDGKNSDLDYVYVVDTAGNLITTPYNSTVYSYPWTGSNAGTRWISDGSGQYYLDIQVPVSAIRNVWPQYTSGTPVKLYYGSSMAANLATINKDFMIPGDTAVTTASLNNMATVKVKDPVVTFDSQGGSAVPSQSLTGSTTTATQPGSPTRTGYAFDGWFTAASGGTQWSFSTTITADTTLHAQWTQQRAVTFDSQGGTSVSAQTVNHGGLATQPTTPTRTGQTFGGWWTTPSAGGSQWNFSADTVTADTTLYARWTASTYTVQFDTQGGSTAPADQTVAHDGLVSVPTAPTRTGYTFGGWWTAASGGTAWDFAADEVNEAVTLYARWTVNSYTVSFDSHGGSAVASQSIDHGDRATAPTAPNRTGYTFDGWWTTASTGGTPWLFATDTVTAARTLHARWTIRTYTVSFDTNGGSGTIADQSVEYGDTVDAPTDPARPGHAFAGWFTSPTGGTAWNLATDTVTGAATLFAQWTIVAPGTCVLSFDSTGGSAVTSQSVTCGEAAVQPAAPVRDGYAFDGWYTAPTGGTAWNFTLQTVTAATTVYARWTPVPPDPTAQTITFVPPAALEVGASSPLSPSASSGLPVSVLSSTPGICVVSGGTVAALAPGSCVLVATQPGSNTYAAAAPVTVSFPVQPLPPEEQSLLFAPPSVLLSGAGPVPLTATATSGLPVTVTLVSGDCSLDGQNLTAPRDTTCTVRASQEGARGWLPAVSVVAQIRFVSPMDDFASMPSPITGPTSLDIAILANDPAGLRLERVGLPARGTAVAQVGSVTYRPAAKLHGTDEFSYQVSDALGRTADAMVWVDVANAEPQVTSHEIGQVAGTTTSVTVEASDPNDDPITLSSKADKHVHVTITGREVQVSPDDTVSGWVTVKVSADDGFGGTGIGLIRSLVRPHPVERVVRELEEGGTMVSWTEAVTDQARYRVLVDGRTVCTTSRTECLIGRILGPDFTVKVQVLGLHGTVSTKKVAVARGHEQVLLRTVYFEPGIATLGTGQMRKLAAVSGLIRRLGFHDAHVSGYTDSDGGASYNLALSRDRTKMVANYLRDAQRIKSDQAWFGYDDPVASNDSAAGKALNRRVEILVSY